MVCCVCVPLLKSVQRDLQTCRTHFCFVKTVQAADASTWELAGVVPAAQGTRAAPGGASRADGCGMEGSLKSRPRSRPVVCSLPCIALGLNMLGSH